MTCKNCGATFEGKFCSDCGQKADTHRITIGHFFHELVHAITHTDKGFLLLAKSLLTRPGYVAKEYIEGQRKKYFNPISFLVITTAISAFATYESGYFEAFGQVTQTEAQASRQSAPQKKYSPGAIAFFKAYAKAGKIGNANTKLLELILIFPLIALFVWMFFFRKINFAESLVFNAFIMGQYNIMNTLIFVPAFLIAPDTIRINNTILHVVYLTFMIIAYYQFFKSNIFVVIIKAIMVMILYVIFYWLLLIGFVLLKDAIVG